MRGPAVPRSPPECGQTAGVAGVLSEGEPRGGKNAERGPHRRIYGFFFFFFCVSFA